LDDQGIVVQILAGAKDVSKPSALALGVNLASYTKNTGALSLGEKKKRA